MKKKRFQLNVGKRQMSWVLVLMFLYGLTGFGVAEEIKTLTLGEAIKIALKNNPALKQASNQVQLNQISVKQKRTNFYPDLQISASSSRQYFNTLSAQTGEYESEDSSNLNVNISTSINLFNGFYDIASLRQSMYELEAAKGNFSRSNQAIIFETLQCYIQVVTSKELIEVEKENLKAQYMQLIRIEDFFKAGRRPVTDLYQQKAEIARSEYQLLNSERNYEINKLLLLQTMGGEQDTNYQVSDPGIENILDEIKTFNKDEVLREAIQKRPDMKAQNLEIEAAQKGIKAAKSGYWPTLSLFADLGTNYNSNTNSFDFSNQFFDNNLNATIGLSLSIPIFDKGITKSNVASAKVQLENQQLELENLKNQVNVEVRQAIENYRTAVQQVKVAESQLTYTKAALESVEARYNVNSATMLELIQSRARYLEATYDRVIAKYNLLTQTIAAEFYTGDSDAMLAMINKKGE
jgi:outer membrane protein